MPKRKQKPNPPTRADVTKEIKLLRGMEDRVRRRSSFGDDNRAAIRAQIRVLSEVLSEDRIYSEYQPLNYEGEPDDEGNRHELDNALDALRWLNGDSSERPSDGWKELCDGRA